MTNLPIPIKIQCVLPGHEADYILFKCQGWKYKHLRLWENARGADNIAEIVTERIDDWHIVIDGVELKFLPGAEAFDELTPDLASWVIVAYHEAYQQAGLPSPN